MLALHSSVEEWDGTRFTRAPHRGIEEHLCRGSADRLTLILKFSAQNDILQLVAANPRIALKFHRIGEHNVFSKLYRSYSRVPRPSRARIIHEQIEAAHRVCIDREWQRQQDQRALWSV